MMIDDDRAWILNEMRFSLSTWQEEKRREEKKKKIINGGFRGGESYNIEWTNEGITTPSTVSNNEKSRTFESD